MRRALTLAGAVLLLSAPGAFAESAIIGLAQPSTASMTDEIHCTCTLIQTALPVGDVVSVPGIGRITAWWALGGNANGVAPIQGALRIARNAASGDFQILGTSSTQTLSPTRTEFPTLLGVRSGELISVQIAGTGNQGGPLSWLYFAEDPSGSASEIDAPVADGRIAAANPQPQMVLALGARFYYTPVFTAESSQSGSTAGGGTVVITGDHLTDTTAVDFGAVAAPSFHVDSNTQITATAPAHAAGAVDVTVAGPGGPSATLAADTYTFIAPKASLSASAIAFGSVPVGSASPPRPVAVTNSGTVPLAIATTALSGSSDFTRSSDGCAGTTLGPGASCTIEIAFTPSGAGNRAAQLKIADNSAAGPHTVSIAGAGAAAGSGVSGSGTSGAGGGFTVGRLRGLTLPVTVDARGTVKVIDTARHRQIYTSTATGGPGTLKVKLRLTAHRKHRTLTIHARVSFTPRGGRAESVTTTLRVRT